jgi:MFS family permease
MNPEPSKLDKSGKIIVTVLCLVNLIANSAYSSIAPFFPDEALKAGVSKSALGVIFSGFSIAMLISAPFLGQMLTSMGRKNVLIMGCVCESISMGFFGFLAVFTNPTNYFVAAFVCRFANGFGNACLNSATSSIICV